MTKVRNSKSHQRQKLMMVSKKLGKLDIDTDELDIDLNINKHVDWNLVLAHHKEEYKIYPLTTIEIAEAQHKDQELEVYFKTNAKNATKGYMFSTY